MFPQCLQLVLVRMAMNAATAAAYSHDWPCCRPSRPTACRVVQRQAAEALFNFTRMCHYLACRGVEVVEASLLAAADACQLLYSALAYTCPMGSLFQMQPKLLPVLLVPAEC